MKDGARVYPVNKLIMHHAVSDLMIDWDDIAVQDWFSTIGKARGYSNGAIWPNHEHPSRPGQPTYSMAHWCLHRYTKDGNKYGWRLTELIKDSWNNVAWHAGNWPVNQQSIGIETAGNYVAEELDQKAFMLVADTFRAHDQHLGGALQIYGHKTFFATACPGLIFQKLDILIDMINNPAKWNNTLWPPTPVITTKDTTIEIALSFKSEVVEDSTLPLGELRLRQAGKMGRQTTVTRTTYSDGAEIKRETISNTVIPAVNEITVRGTYVEPPVIVEPSQPTEPEKPVDPTTPKPPKDLTPWQKLLLALVDFFNKLPRNKKP